MAHEAYKRLKSARTESREDSRGTMDRHSATMNGFMSAMGAKIQGETDLCHVESKQKDWSHYLFFPPRGNDVEARSTQWNAPILSNKVADEW